jgi:hypothetical protein
MSPHKGPAVGGAKVMLTGRNFDSVVAIRFGGVCSTNFTVTSATSITATAPPETPKIVDVTVITSAGTTPVSKRDRFRFK